MDKYICTVCEYIYDPELGDPENGIAHWVTLKMALRQVLLLKTCPMTGYVLSVE